MYLLGYADSAGPDRGTQYRSGIYTVGEKQLNTARQVLGGASLGLLWPSNRDGTGGGKTFWAAEDYHQDYIAKTGRRAT